MGQWRGVGSHVITNSQEVAVHSGRNVVIRTRINGVISHSYRGVYNSEGDGLYMIISVTRCRSSSESTERVGPLFKSGGVCEGINKDNE